MDGEQRERYLRKRHILYNIMSIGASRNHPCVCGSTKKFKKCCWDKKPDEIRYNHIHAHNDPMALCLTCRENAQKLATQSAQTPEPITAEL